MPLLFHALERTLSHPAPGDEYRRIIDSLGAVLWEANPETFQFTYVSSRAATLLGFPVAEWLAPGFWRARTHPDDVDWATVFCLDSTAQGHDHQFEYRMIAADGRVVWIHDVVTLKREADMSRRLSGIMIDITERKRTAERLREVEAELRQTQKMEAIGRLAGGVAHDFNNLLTVITGHADLALASTAQDERLAEVLEIRRAADRAALLTQQLLTFSRKQVLKPRVLDINAEIEGVRTMLSRLGGAEIRFQLDLDPAAGAVLLDAGQFHQILMNLVVNARDAMPQGGRISIETRDAHVETEAPAQPSPIKPGRYARLVFMDDGVGMAPDVLSQCFEPFFTTKPAGHGTGLGLSAVYGIVTQSHGHLRVESTPGGGTRFELHFPRVGVPPATGEAVAARRPTPAGETILIAEDSPVVLRLAARVLSRGGYRVLEAADAEQALQLAAAHKGTIDLVLTDVIMPGIPGPALVERLEIERPGVRVLYMSGYTGDYLTLHGLDEQHVNLLSKPFSPDQLSRRVREVLDSE